MPPGWPWWRPQAKAHWSYNKVVLYPLSVASPFPLEAGERVPDKPLCLHVITTTLGYTRCCFTFSVLVVNKSHAETLSQRCSRVSLFTLWVIYPVSATRPQAHMLHVCLFPFLFLFTLLCQIKSKIARQTTIKILDLCPFFTAENAGI